MKHYSFIEESFSLLSIQVNNSKNNKIAKIMIFPNDGDNEPHMHINSTNLGGKIGLYLRTSKKYYEHDGWKDHFKNSKKKKIFNDILNIKDKDGITYWQKIIFLWNENHKYGPKHCHLNEQFIHPDYTKLP